MHPTARRALFASLLGVAGGCRLDASDKTSCDDSRDCLRDRVCVEGQCSDDGCVSMCEAYCDALEDCGDAPPADCVEGCVSSTSPSQCKLNFDALPTLNCNQLGCVNRCTSVCEIAASCAIIGDLPRCVDGCWTWGYCPQSAQECIDVPSVSCYEPGTECP